MRTMLRRPSVPLRSPGISRFPMVVALVAWATAPAANLSAGDSRDENKPPATRSAASAPASAPLYTYRDDHDRDGIGKFYMGREIAHVMGHLGAAWLERPERVREEQPDRLMAALKLNPGQVAADIGAGTGYFTTRLAEAVGRTGRVKAVDIQQEMLDLLDKKLKQQSIDNVDLILGKEDDPTLPRASIDLVLLVDVYHEFEFPYEMMQRIVDALRPGGRVAFVEFRLEDPDVPIKRLHKMSEEQVRREMQPHRLRHRETVETLPWQHIIIFEKPPAASGPASPVDRTPLIRPADEDQ